jgi:hypothetical protein
MNNVFLKRRIVPNFIVQKNLFLFFEKRVIDVFQQNLFSDIVYNNVLNTYLTCTHFKNNFSFECY